jgi:predicted CXXCH cytochrome family protein
MFRDWRIPVWNANGLDGQGAWVGQEVRQFDVIPSYKFWNGQSFVYSAGQALPPETDGSYYEAKALGSINSGKLYPIKIHTAYQPIQNGTNTLVMFDVLWNFLTGRYEEAAQRGLDSMGTGGTYNWALVKTDQLITHGVEPKAASLQCAACHETRTQMNLSTLGYTLKDTQTNVCTQCHENKQNPGFYALHTKHVTGKRIDCSMCHSFSRPERGLLPGVMTDN